MTKKLMGLSIDDFMKEEGVFEEAQAQAIKEVVAWQLAEAMEKKKISTQSCPLKERNSIEAAERWCNGVLAATHTFAGCQPAVRLTRRLGKPGAKCAFCSTEHASTPTRSTTRWRKNPKQYNSTMSATGPEDPPTPRTSRVRLRMENPTKSDRGRRILTPSRCVRSLSVFPVSLPNNSSLPRSRLIRE